MPKLKGFKFEKYSPRKDLMGKDTNPIISYLNTTNSDKKHSVDFSKSLDRIGHRSIYSMTNNPGPSTYKPIYSTIFGNTKSFVKYNNPVISNKKLELHRKIKLNIY
jgi:hypothetical protein